MNQFNILKWGVVLCIKSLRGQINRTPIVFRPWESFKLLNSWTERITRFAIQFFMLIVVVAALYVRSYLLWSPRSHVVFSTCPRLHAHNSSWDITWIKKYFWLEMHSKSKNEAKILFFILNELEFLWFKRCPRLYGFKERSTFGGENT